MIKKILYRDVSKQFYLFLFVGSITTSLNYLIFFLLYKKNVYYVYSSIIGYLAGLMLGYILNKRITFNSSKSISKSMSIYFFVNLISILIIAIFLPFFVNKIHLNPLFSNLILLIFTTFLNFFLSKTLAFNNKKW